MSLAVVPGAGRDRYGSVQSAKSINYNEFSPVAASVLPRDDEVTMNMYNGTDTVDNNNITIMPKVAKTEPKITRKESGSKAGSFVMNAAQVKTKPVMNGGVKHANIVEKTVTKNTETKGEKTKEVTKTVETSNRGDSVKRNESNKSNSGTKVKKAGSFQMKSAHSGVELPKNTTKALDNTEFKSNLQRTLERKTNSAKNPSSDTNEVALRSNVSSVSTTPNMSSTHSINKSVSGGTGVERHTSLSDNSHLVTHKARITSGGGDITSEKYHSAKVLEDSEKRQSGAGLNSSGVIAPKDSTGVGLIDTKSILSNSGHNRDSYSYANTNIYQVTQKGESDEKERNKPQIANSQTSSRREDEVKSSYIKSETVIRPSSDQIPGGTEAQRTHSEIKYSVGNNKQILNGSDNSLSVNAGARSSYTFDDVTGRSSEQVAKSRSPGDVPGKTSPQSGKNKAFNSETKLINSKQEGNRESNVSEWSSNSETGKNSRPDSLLFNSEEHKARVGKQLSATLPTGSERLEERQTLFSPGRVQAHAVQFENRDDVKSPISPAALEAQEAVKSGIVGKLSGELKHLPLTGRSLDAATLEKKKKSASTSSESQSLQKKQPKFLVEGIDYPAPEKKEEGTELEGPRSSDLLKSETSLVSTDTDSENTTLQRTEKKGFAYLKDKAITSEVLKRAETVTSKKPHEAVEVRTLDNQLRAKSPEESTHLIEARSHLHRVESKKRPPTAETSPNPIQFALKKSLLGEIHKTVDKKEASSSGQGNNSSAGDPDITKDEEKVEVATKEADKSVIDPLYQRHLPRQEENTINTTVVYKKTESEEGIARVITQSKTKRDSNISSDEGVTSFISHSEEDLDTDTQKENQERVAVVRVNSGVTKTSQNNSNYETTVSSKKIGKSTEEDEVVKVSTHTYDPNTSTSSKYEDDTARIYVKTRSDKVVNNTDRTRKDTAPDSAYASNPTSPAFEFDLKAANLQDEPEMVVQQSTVQHGAGPPGMYRAERKVKSSYSTKASGQPEKKMESETKESFEWRGDDGRAVAQGGIPQQQAIKSSSSQRQALKNEGRAPNVIPLTAVDVDIENRNHINSHPDVTSPTVKHMQSLFETQNIASNYSQNQDFMSGPNATSSVQRTDLRRTGDADVNYQKVPIIRSGYERKAFEEVQNNRATPSEPVGTFQNLQSLKTNYEYQSSTQQSNRMSEAMPTKNMRMSAIEVNTGNQNQSKKRRRNHVTNVSVEDGYEGGYASSSDAGSLIHTRQSVSPYPGMQRSVTPTVAGQTLISGGSMNRTTQDINTNTVNTDRVITPHLREATEENGEYHIKLDLNTNMQQAMRSAVAQTSESMTREEMMRNEQYRTSTGTNQFATTGSTGVAGQTIEGFNTNTMVNNYNSYGGSRGPTPTVNGKTDFLMNVNQTMTLDYVPRGNTPVPREKSISNIHLEDEHRKAVHRDDHYAVKSLTRTQHVPQPEPDRRYVETLQVTEDRKTPQINVERGNYLIKNSIDTTSAPKVVDIVEDNYIEDDVNIEDNTNMFDGLYYQSKLNPMYSSDQDLRNPDLYRDEVDNRRTTTVRTVKTVRDVPREEVVDYNSNIKYRLPRHDTTSSWTYHKQRQPSESSSMESVEYEQQQRSKFLSSD